MSSRKSQDPSLLHFRSTFILADLPAGGLPGVAKALGCHTEESTSVCTVRRQNAVMVRRPFGRDLGWKPGKPAGTAVACHD